MKLDVLTQLWLDLYTKGKSLQSFFIENDVKNIAIYGGGTIGALFFNEVKRYGINVNLCIDKTIIQFNNIKTISPSHLSDDDLIGVELIVICVDHDTKDIIDDISGRVECDIITFREILTVCFYSEVINPYCEKMGVKLYIVSYPLYKDIPNLSSEEKILAFYSSSSYVNNPKYFEDLYKLVDEYGDEYIREVFTQSPVIVNGNRKVHSDVKSKYVNIINGVRFTHFAPETFNHTIHFTGNCVALGYGVDDSRTIPSYLQKKLNTYVEESSRYRALNHGVWGCDWNDLCRIYETLKSISLNAGDIVFKLDCDVDGYRRCKFDYYEKILNKTYSAYSDLYKEFCGPREIPLMIDGSHLSYYGMERVADCIFDILKSDGVLDNSNNQSETFSSRKITAANIRNSSSNSAAYPKELEDYISSLSKHKKDKDNIGAIVMNCNPFTKGHRYLIEEASSQVDYLYIFVVEEDKSAFSFDDRVNLVKLGTKDLQNVIVLPSGKYILSTITFPEYFVKDSLKEVSVDTSIDIEIFAKSIAPVLNISKRFVGQEPFDMITRQYNQTMKDILPKYGIRLIEIERLVIDNHVVSASYVRKLIENSNFMELANFVPDVVFDYLQNKYLLTKGYEEHL